MLRKHKCDYENTLVFYGLNQRHTFYFYRYFERNETFGSNILRSATASRLGSVPRKSAENAVFLRYLRGGFK